MFADNSSPNRADTPHAAEDDGRMDENEASAFAQELMAHWRFLAFHPTGQAHDMALGYMDALDDVRAMLMRLRLIADCNDAQENAGLALAVSAVESARDMIVELEARGEGK